MHEHNLDTERLLRVHADAEVRSVGGGTGGRPLGKRDIRAGILEEARPREEASREAEAELGGRGAGAIWNRLANTGLRPGCQAYLSLRVLARVQRIKGTVAWVIAKHVVHRCCIMIPRFSGSLPQCGQGRGGGRM